MAIYAQLFVDVGLRGWIRVLLLGFVLYQYNANARQISIELLRIFSAKTATVAGWVPFRPPTQTWSVHPNLTPFLSSTAVVGMV